MDGGSTMSREHSGVKKYFEESCKHKLNRYCRSHRLASCFAHLIPKYDEFKQVKVLLLILYYILKNSSVRQSIFEEVQKAYKLTSLKAIEAAATCWLGHGYAAQRVLDCYKPLVAELDIIYLCKSEPAV